LLRFARNEGVRRNTPDPKNHFYLAAERQIECHLESPSACAAEMSPIRELFRAMWEVDQTWLPALRSMCQNAALEGKAVTRLTSPDEIDAFTKNM
jgi:hypothetical protein